MLIALLAVLGVDLIVVVVILAAVLARRRWVNHRPGVFAGAIRVSAGEHDGVGSKWRRGYGRWVRDVFVWTKKPFLFRNELVAVIQIAVHGPDRDLALGPYGDRDRRDGAGDAVSASSDRARSGQPEAPRRTRSHGT